MKWFIFAAFAACLAWYFSNETLQNLGLFLHHKNEWRNIATGWHILGKLWPVWLILILGGGLVTGLVLYFFSSTEEKMKDGFEKRVAEISKDYASRLEQKGQQDKQLLGEVLRLSNEKKGLEGQIEELIGDNKHQHSTIQRLHKKIKKLQTLSL